MFPFTTEYKIFTKFSTSKVVYSGEFRPWAKRGKGVGVFFICLSCRLSFLLWFFYPNKGTGSSLTSTTGSENYFVVTRHVKMLIIEKNNTQISVIAEQKTQNDPKDKVILIWIVTSSNIKALHWKLTIEQWRGSFLLTVSLEQAFSVVY